MALLIVGLEHRAPTVAFCIYRAKLVAPSGQEIQWTALSDSGFKTMSCAGLGPILISPMHTQDREANSEHHHR